MDTGYYKIYIEIRNMLSKWCILSIEMQQAFSSDISGVNNVFEDNSNVIIESEAI